jgi:hypothetical protein
MIWMIGFFVTLATFFALFNEDKLKPYRTPTIIGAFLFFMLIWPATVIYRYCL